MEWLISIDNVVTDFVRQWHPDPTFLGSTSVPGPHPPREIILESSIRKGRKLQENYSLCVPPLRPSQYEGSKSEIEKGYFDSGIWPYK